MFMGWLIAICQHFAHDLEKVLDEDFGSSGKNPATILTVYLRAKSYF